MNKAEKLKQQQPIVWRTLHNCLTSATFAHAYLFYGAQGTSKKETALLFAQSILCPHPEDGFACETCSVCRRVETLDYVDLCLIDGSEVSIKKGDVMKLQEMFTKTALEEKSYKIYIMNHVENATPDAMNALLKFLEEPVSDVVAILISDQLESVMPTIVSRCQCIPFHALNRQESYEQGIAVCDAYDAYLLSALHCSVESMREISESEDYQHARAVFFELIEKMASGMDEAALFLQTKGYPSKNKKLGKASFAWMLNMLIQYVKDLSKETVSCRDTQYLALRKKKIWNQTQLIDVLSILLGKKDLLRQSVNLQLLIDHMMYELKEVKG